MYICIIWLDSNSIIKSCRFRWAMEGLDCHNTQQPALYTPQLDQTAQFRLTNSALPSPSNWLQRLNNRHPVILRLDWLVTCNNTHSSLDHTALSLQRAAGQFFVSCRSDGLSLSCLLCLATPSPPHCRSLLTPHTVPPPSAWCTHCCTTVLYTHRHYTSRLHGDK